MLILLSYFSSCPRWCEIRWNNSIRLNVELIAAFLWGWSDIEHASKESFDLKWNKMYISIVPPYINSSPRYEPCSGLLWFHSDFPAGSTEIKWNIRKQLSINIVCLFSIRMKKIAVFLWYIIYFLKHKKDLLFSVIHLSLKTQKSQVNNLYQLWFIHMHFALPFPICFKSCPCTCPCLCNSGHPHCLWRIQ